MRDAYGCRVCNAASIQLTSDGGKGQGYLVRDADGYKIFTVRHVIEKDEKIRAAMTGCFSSLRLNGKDFQCESSHDADASCAYLLSETETKFVDDLCFALPLHRLRGHLLLVEGAHLAFMRGQETRVAQISEINEEFIFIDLRTIEVVDGKRYVTINNFFCVGDSGGPAMLVHPPREDRQFDFVAMEGRPISVGEVEHILSAGDIPGWGLCGGIGIIRRPER